MGQRSKFKTLVAALAIGGAAAAATLPATAFGQNEQFFPVLPYRSGPFAPSGVPYANAYVDFLKLTNVRDGGMNGVKAIWEECDTGYNTDRGVECYERLKAKGPTGATVFQPLSTGITYAVTAKVAQDKVPLITAGYGISEAAYGPVFAWNFVLGGNYWAAADILVQHVGKKEGGRDKLKGKKITLIYHDSPYGKEPIPVLEELSKIYGFKLGLLPVASPGLEQKATWLQIRRDRPDYIFLWGWGVMNSTAIKEAVATGFPREKMYGVWWSAGEPDVIPAGDGAKGYNGLELGVGAGRFKIHEDILKLLHAKGEGTGPAEEVGTVLYNRGLVQAMYAVEAVRTAQARFGKKPMTGEQVRWALENLSIDAKRLEQLGFGDNVQPVSTTCQDHMGPVKSRIQTWDGKHWKPSSDWYEADAQILKPFIQKAALKFAAEKKIPVRDCAKESQK